jgi:hypothetical protein
MNNNNNNNNNTGFGVKVFDTIHNIINSVVNYYNHQNRKPLPLVRQNAFNINDISSYNVTIVKN